MTPPVEPTPDYVGEAATPPVEPAEVDPADGVADGLCYSKSVPMSIPTNWLVDSMQHSNAQRETQLLAEWWATLPRGWPNKTHVNVGASQLVYQGQPLSPARQRAFGVWNDWADMRIFTGFEVWLVEAKIVNIGAAYGQLIDYVDEYSSSDDYRQFIGYPIVPIVLCAFERARTTGLFARLGVRTIVFTPSWAADTLVNKVFGGFKISGSAAG